MSRFRSIRPELVAQDPDLYASMLTHENAFLRARLEGKGRIEVDPDLQRILDRTTKQHDVATAKLERAEAEVLRLREERVRAENRAKQLLQQIDSIKADRDRLQRIVAELRGKTTADSSPAVKQLQHGQAQTRDLIQGLQTEMTGLRLELDARSAVSQGGGSLWQRLARRVRLMAAGSVEK